MCTHRGPHSFSARAFILRPIVRRKHAADIYRLAWPVLVAQLAVIAYGVIDTVVAGRYSTEDLAAVGIGAAIYFSVFVALMGVLIALSPIVAQLLGAGRHGEIGEQVRQGMWLTLGLALLSIVVFAYPEPLLALSPGADGLSALRTIALGGVRHLHPGGWLLLEHGHAQGAAVRELLRAAGFADVETRADLAGLPRCSGGRIAHPA